MDIKDLHADLKTLEEQYGLTFQLRPMEAGLKLQKLISTAFIAGRRKARLELAKKQ